MRDVQEQLVDLQNAVGKGLRDIKIKRFIKYAYPIVLEGWEGVIIRDLLELIMAGDKDISKMSKGGAISYEGSAVLCSQEFPLPGGK